MKVVESTETVPVYEMRVRKIMKWSVIVSLIALGGFICLAFFR